MAKVVITKTLIFWFETLETAFSSRKKSSKKGCLFQLALDEALGCHIPQTLAVSASLMDVFFTHIIHGE